MKKETNSNKLMKDPPNKSVGGIFYFRTKAIALMLFCLFTLFGNAQAIAKVDTAKKSFDRVKKGVVVEFKYTITNVGKEPLLLQDYDVQCSCTSVSFDNKPIAPGKSTVVTVKFDTKTVYEKQDRVVRIISNNKGGDIKLRFKGYVEGKSELK